MNRYKTTIKSGGICYLWFIRPVYVYWFWKKPHVTYQCISLIIRILQISFVHWNATKWHENVIRWTCISISSNVKTGICHADGGMTGLSYIVSFARNILSLIVKYRIIIIYVRYLSDYRRPYSSSRFHDNSFRHFRLCQSLNRLIVNKIHFMMTNGIIGRLKNQDRKLIIRNIAASSSDIPLIPVRHPLFLHQTSVQ